MTAHAQQQAMIEAAEAALDATHTRRAKLIELRSKLTAETANNELAMVQAKAKLKATKKYAKDWGDWVASAMRANPTMSLDQAARGCPITPPQ